MYIYLYIYVLYIIYIYIYIYISELGQLIWYLVRNIFMEDTDRKSALKGSAIPLFSFGRHFSHVTKSSIFKNLDLRKKADRNFRGNFLKNRFMHLKLYSNLPSWLAWSCCHMGTSWKTKEWSFSESQPLRFWYVKVHHQRRLKSTKTGISSKF